MNSPEVQLLLNVCDRFRAGQVDLGMLHDTILSVVDSIREPSRGNLKDVIESAAEELGVIRVTSLNQHSDALRILDKLEATIRNGRA